MSDQAAPLTFAAHLLDPEFAALLSELPDFVFNAETLPMTRELMPGPSPPADDVERSDHTVNDGPVVVSIHRDYIEIFYNRERSQAGLGHLSPFDYEAALVVA